MDIFPELLSENEFRYFKDEDYAALEGVLNDTLAKIIKDYCNNPASDHDIVSKIKERMGDTIEKYTLHMVLQDRGIPDLVQSLMPDQLLESGVDLDHLIEELTFLEENYDKVLTNIPKRNKKQWETFHSAIVMLVVRMDAEGVTTTYDHLPERIAANSFLFYSPKEKDHGTRIGVISAKRKQWTIALNGAKFIKRCDAEGISTIERRRI